MNVGIIVNELDNSQLAFLAINQCNVLPPEYNPVIFYKENLSPCVKPKFSIMSTTEINGFSGLLISTNIDTTLMMTSVPNSAKKMFYVWDLEWLRRGKNDYLFNMRAFRNKEVALVCRSTEHALAVSQYANRENILVVPNLHLAHIIKFEEQLNEICRT